MGFLSQTKYKTLSGAVMAGDLRAVRKMLDQGADPNRCDPNDDSYPIHYALNHGPEMVQLLIDHGADVNIAARGAMPLAKAEARGYTEVASILRRAGARLSADNEKFSIDPRFRLEIEPMIRQLLFQFCLQYHDTLHIMSLEEVAGIVEPHLHYRFPPNTPLQLQEHARKEIRAFILQEYRRQTRYGAK